MTDELPLGPGAEFDAIREMVARWGPRAVGIGDDAAVIKVPRGDSLVASVDAFVEGRHFQRAWLTSREIGYRSVAVALSDLAAMAAEPLGILVALAVPFVWREAIFDIADGIGDAVDASGTSILGGNITNGDQLSITTTVLGSAFAPLSRRGAAAGDQVYVTGRLGGAGTAVIRLYAGEPAGVFHDRFAQPVPRIAEARWLADRGASAAIDISDGLFADARHLAAASGVSITIDAVRLPLFEGAEMEQALNGGEDYELLLTAPSEIDEAAFAERFGIPLTRIGSVGRAEDGEGGVTCVTVAGARVAGAAGYDHFSQS